MPLLFNTRLRRKLLTYFFTHPDEDYYVRELAGIIEEDPGNLSRELRKLEDEGVCNSHPRGNSKFYSLNKKYPLFNELKNIILKTEGVEGSLRELILKYKNVSLAFIYGSYAKGKEKKTSDIDLLIVGNFPQDEFTSQIRKLELKLNREINFTSYTKKEFEKEKRKKGGFLDTILQDKLIILKGKINVE
jgi:predicted nucleotidyltransferase